MSTSLAARLWTYQAERFPLVQVIPLLGIFSAASVNISAVLAQRPLPGWDSYALAFVLAVVLFFQMRVCDEVKDAEIDRTYRPERPVPRGLISLRLLITMAFVAAAIALAAAAFHGPVIWLLLGVWVWLTAMTLEFGVADWLKARPLIYLVSHMAIMPLIDIMLTGVEWADFGRPAAGLWVFVGLSFANGCVLELGRKTWAPENERPGVESYSGIWGPGPAAKIWFATVLVAGALMISLGTITGQIWIFAAITAVAVSGCAWVGIAFLRAPSPRAQKRLDTVSGLWVFLCYASAGFVPLLSVA